MGIENGPLWTSYCKSRAAIRKISETLGCMEGEWKKNAEAALDVVNQGQAKILERGTVRKFVNKLNLDTSKKNEVLLFHGCPGKGALDNEGKVQLSENWPTCSCRGYPSACPTRQHSPWRGCGGLPAW